jgi:hypothetical protein
MKQGEMTQSKEQKKSPKPTQKIDAYELPNKEFK